VGIRVRQAALTRPRLGGGVGDPVLHVGKDRAGGGLQVLRQQVQVLGVLDQLRHVGGPDEPAVVAEHHGHVIRDHREPVGGNLIEAYRQLSGEVRG
jgi:hypothetical protein